MSDGKRYLFYDVLNGEILIVEARNRLSIMPTVERVIEIYPILSERNRETFDVLELEYDAYAQDFREGILIGIDLETKLPKFAYPNEENPSEPIVTDVPLTTQIETLEANFMYDSMMKDMAIEEANSSQAELMYQLMMNGVI